MAFKDRFIDVLNAVLPGSWKVGFREAIGYPIDPDEANWRPLTSDANRDLPLITQEHMLRVAHWLWEQNPLANWIIEVRVAFLLAEGVRLEVKDPDNQKVLDRFWRDPINEMALKLPKKVRELSLFGEQVYPVFLDEVEGTPRLGYLDPKLIGEVVVDPDNAEQPIGVVSKRDRKGEYRKYRVIINGPESVFTQRTQQIRASFTDGECFYFRVNDLSAGRRGRSDLLPLADWLDVYEQFLFGEGERAKILRALVWDLTLKNADKNAVTKRSREFQLPASGGVYAHNDSETLEPKVPDLKAADTSEAARTLRNHILGGAGLPEHWYGGGGDVNRAAAQEMGAPTYKLLAMRQTIWKNILEMIGRYALMAEARAKGQKAEDIDWSDPKWAVQAIFPELVTEDVTKYAAAAQQLVVGCVLAIDKGLMSQETAVQLIAAVASRLGVDIDAKQELESAQAELAAKKAEDVFTTPPGAGAVNDPELAAAMGAGGGAGG